MVVTPLPGPAAAEGRPARACTGGSVCVPHTAAGVPVARRALVEDLHRDPRATAVADEVAVVASELLGNAVRHAAPFEGGVLMRWRLTDEEIRVEVVDGGGASGAPAERDAELFATSGRGLHIVGVLAHRWGSTTDGGGHRTVWASVCAPPLAQAG